MTTRDGAGRPAGGRLWVVPAALAAFLATQYGYAWRVPFINDDFAFLDQARAMRFADVWEIQQGTEKQ